ncbi:MAG TPA: hypothetical protein VHZ95_08875 [Polyangiales bacterium]|nr:hypothetical protein [Polyangiales bacterium]
MPLDLATVAPDWTAACERLQALAERGLFVERHAPARRDRAQADTTDPRVARLAKGYWRLHDLLRSALREPPATGLPDVELAADLVDHLVEVERLDLAWQVATHLDGELLARVVDEHGSPALRSDFLASLVPLTQRHANRKSPSVALWLARAMIGNDNAAALKSCDEAFEGYRTAGDDAGQALAASLALFVIFASIENVGNLATWGERLGRFPVAGIDAIEHEEASAIRVAGRVAYHLLVEGRERDSGAGSAMQDLLARVVSAEILAANETLLAGSLLVSALRRALRVNDVEILVFKVDELRSVHDATPHLQARWNIENGFHFSLVGRFDEARRRFHEDAFRELERIEGFRVAPFEPFDARSQMDDPAALAPEALAGRFEHRERPASIVDVADADIEAHEAD